MQPLEGARDPPGQVSAQSPPLLRSSLAARASLFPFASACDFVAGGACSEWQPPACDTL